MSKARPTAATIRRRIEEVLRIRLDGAEFWDVREYAREKEAEEGTAWHLAEGEKPLSDGQLRRYLARVDGMIAESCRASRKKLLRRHLAQRRNLYAKAVAQGDVRAALSVLADEAKLLGLYAPVKVAPTDPTGEAPYMLSDAERMAALSRLYAQLGAADGSAMGNGQAGADGPVADASAARVGEGAGQAQPTAGGAVASTAEEDGPTPLFPEFPGR